MNLLSLENITKAYTERVLLDGASFFLQEGEKVGIIGINGTGKSTLLKLAAGLEEPDTGSCTKANHVVIRYLPQTPEFDDSCTVWEHVEKKISESTQWDMEGEAKRYAPDTGDCPAGTENLGALRRSAQTSGTGRNPDAAL